MGPDEAYDFIHEDQEFIQEKDLIIRSVSVKNFMELVVDKCKNSDEE